MGNSFKFSADGISRDITGIIPTIIMWATLAGWVRQSGGWAS